jgi:flagellar hook-basal body complex protein FliE
MINPISTANKIQEIFKNQFNSSQVKNNSLETKDSTSFADIIQKSIEKVNDAHIDADKMASDLATGKNVDIHQTMIALEKADISFQFMMQVRNKLVSAYQEISRMQV